MTEELTCFVITTLLTEVLQTWQRLLYTIVHINPVIKCYVISFCFIFVVSVPVPIFACVEQLALFDGLLLCLNYFKIELSSLGGFAFLKILRFKR